MRILFVISGLGYGGAERQFVMLARELVRLGHAVVIYTLNRHVPREAELDGSGVELIVDQKRARLDPFVVARLRRSARRFGADVMHGVLYDGDIYARLAGWGLGIPVFGSERSDSYSPNRLQRAGYALTRGLVHAVIANSHAGARFARGLHGIDASRFHVVWNGIDIAEVDRRLAVSARPALGLWPEPGVRRVAFVGAIKPVKDHALALRVAHELHRRSASWRFLFVGDSFDGQSGYKQEVLEQARMLGSEAYTRFCGVRADALEIIASSDALLVTSRYEGFPNVVIEAMAGGCPVASTDYSDVRRILPRSWQVAATRDPKELADIVERCIEQRDEVARAQRRWVDEHGGVARAAQALLAVYRSPPQGRTFNRSAAARGAAERTR